MTAQAASPTVDVNPTPDFPNHNVDVFEGLSGTVPVNVTFKLSQSNTHEVTVTYHTENGSTFDATKPAATTSDNDYVGVTNGTVKFPANTTTQQVTLSVKGDNIQEPNELFSVVLDTVTTDASDGFVKGSPGTVTIKNDDQPPILILGDATQTEGNAGTSVMNFPLRLSAPTEVGGYVHVKTKDARCPQAPDPCPPQANPGPATAGRAIDFVALDTDVAIPASPTSQLVNIPVTINGDVAYEANDEFEVVVSKATGANHPDNFNNPSTFGTGTITNDDAKPTVNVSDGSGPEGDDPLCRQKQPDTCETIGFHITLAGATELPVNVKWSTSDRSAHDDQSGDPNFDYYGDTSGSGGVKFDPADADATKRTDQTFTVEVRGDATPEPDERFAVNLAAPTNLPIANALNATIGRGEGYGLIQDDDSGPRPTVRINQTPPDVEVTEGNNANATFTFTGTWPAPPTVNTNTITVYYTTSDGQRDPQGTCRPAIAGSTKDYDATSGSVDIPFTGTHTATVSVPIHDDSQYEGDECFQVQITDVSNASITGNPIAEGKIHDNDAPPKISIKQDTAGQAVSVAEGDPPAQTFANVDVTILPVSGNDTTVTFYTPQNSRAATAGQDYTNTTITRVIPAGTGTSTFQVPIVNDTMDEPSEGFDVAIKDAVGATLDKASGFVTVTDNDAAHAPTVKINSIGFQEGNSGTSVQTFAATLSGPSGWPITVHVATADGTAKAGEDYVAKQADLTFPASSDASAAGGSQDFPVTVNGDGVFEPDETFTVTLSNPAHSSLDPNGKTGTGTIQNDDTAPSSTVSVGNATATEGDNATFTFTLSAAAAGDVTVNYSTADGTAKAPGDYTAVPAGVATIPAGQTTKTVDVPTTEDTTSEPQETFTLTINSASGATVDQAKKTGTGTINDDDAGPITGQITTGAGPGGGPHIQSFTNGPNPVASFMDGDSNNTAGKRVARGDVDGDGVDEIITGSGPGAPSVVSVYSPTGTLKSSSFTYGDNGRFYGGVFVAAGDVDGDGKDEVITGAGPGGGPHVIVWKVVGQSLTALGGFFAYGPEFRGGVTVASADVNGDGKDDIVTGPGAGGGPDVEVNSFNIVTGAASRLFGFMAYTDPNAQPNWTGGINVAAGDLDGVADANSKKHAEIAVVPWSGGGPHLRLFNSDGTLRNGGIFVGSSTFAGGLTVAVGDLTGDGKAEIIVGAWSNANMVRGYDASLNPLSGIDFHPYGTFAGGNFVAVGKA